VHIERAVNVLEKTGRAALLHGFIPASSPGKSEKKSDPLSLRGDSVIAPFVFI